MVRALVSSAVLHVLTLAVFFIPLTRSVQPLRLGTQPIPTSLHYSEPEKARAPEHAPVSRHSHARQPQIEQPQGDQAQTYALEVRNQIESALIYPLEMRRRKLSGQVTLRLSIDATGKLQSRELIESSGHSDLDRLILSTVDHLGRFRAFTPLSLELPIVYRLQ